VCHLVANAFWFCFIRSGSRVVTVLPVITFVFVGVDRGLQF
jgi:hypothetical protein